MRKSGKNKEESALLWHIEKIVYAAEGCALKPEFFENNKKHLDFISKKLQITSFQALIFSFFVNESDSSRITIAQFADFLSCKRISLLSHSDDFAELERRKFIYCYRYDGNSSYRLPGFVMEAISKNEVIKPAGYEKSSVNEVFCSMDEIFTLRINSEMNYDAMTFELKDLIESNTEFLFCQRILKYKNWEDNFILLIYFCHLLVNNSDDSVGFHDFDKIFEDCFSYRVMKSSIKHKSNNLISEGLIEPVFDSGFESREYYHLSNNAKDELFPELKLPESEVKDDLCVVKCSAIAGKTLIYNHRESGQVNTLTSLLKADNLVTIQKQLADNNMRTGFACLFYGPPGTGKTESVYQIARATGRDIFMVDISKIKSMWFGESEKRIKSIFISYKTYVMKSRVAPILLFNEADAVFGKRKDNLSSSVSQTENSIQNIILQEMENLDGIMIATTNLSQNLDGAFDRRFLYKIEFDKPSEYAKTEIWKIMMPSLCESDAAHLSRQFDFSGGQIENIARKCLVDTILTGSKPTIDVITEICRNEKLEKEDVRRQIGF